MEDVLIVGYGPVGQVLSLLLAQQGRRVTVVERWEKAYPMPRAVAFDSEAARILAAAGLGSLINRVGEPSGEYTWTNAAGETLLHIDVAEVGHCWWPESTSMYQPGLEAAMEARGKTLPNLSVLRGERVVELDDLGDHVRVVTDARELSARWVVGCDGANSFVRNRIGTAMHDLEFAHDWLICDVREQRPAKHKPNNLQVCDPARPRTSVSAGPGHRRWEFMRVASDSAAEFNTAETAWKLLGEVGVSPDEAILERHHVYTFGAAYADRWRDGRLLIAGDAAHVMPPFAGQGMSSGFRDAAALSWRLDAVLAGEADERVLDSYTEERREHVKHAITMSVNLGRIICQTDPGAASDRDQVMLAMAKRPAPASAQRSAIRPLSAGFRAAGSPAGDLMPQGRVADSTGTRLFDEVAGHGFVLLTLDAPPDGLPIRAIQLTDDALRDVDGVYASYFARTGTRALLIRPDFYVYGGATDRDGARSLVEQLQADLLGPRAGSEQDRRVGSGAGTPGKAWSAPA
ncbi:bifunctional 3-(3-hydroxy-phenyl)propionate/3-hydroxycinnamic acid hydroxylase [Actinoplanes sp. NPDC023936]|uniref:bifunctional 3-(3-hydroxy-phenyl)propionate/3-hydroxycinnamic acid hydroxylase MhpA n=1 Tax=Actinoplanes sp. NPDC023936 TaxID=3154910 RepID=UPI0033EF0B24